MTHKGKTRLIGRRIKEKTMATSKVCRTVNAYDIWATLITSGLVMAVLFYFVADTTVRFLHKEKVELWTLVAMAISFLIVAQIA